MLRPRFLLASLALVIIATAVNEPTWNYEFACDDHAVVVERVPAWRQGWPKFFSSRQWGTGRHVLALSMDLNWRGKDNPRAYHIVNTALAAGATVLVFAVGTAIGLSPPAAWVGALLFAVHPVHTDAVVSIVGRAEVLAALSVLACVLLHLRGYPVPALSLPFAAVLFWIGLASKESAMVLPLLLLLVDALVPRTARHVRPVVPYLAYALAAAAWGALVYPHLGELDPIAFVDNPIAGLPRVERGLKAGLILWKYAQISLVPIGLKADRAFATTDPSLVGGLLGSAAWLAVLALCWRARHSYPRPVFLVAWFLAAFAVTSNVLFPIGTIMAERLVYLPSVASCLAFGLVAERCWQGGRRVRIATNTAVLLLAVIFALAYQSRGRVWASDEQYVLITTLDSPESAKAHFERGLFAARSHDYDGAVPPFREALRIYPKFSRAAYYLASVFLLQDEPESAADVYVEYLKSDPDDVGVLSQLTTIQLGLERFPEARTTAERLIALEPDNPDHQAMLRLVETTREASEKEKADAQSLNASSSNGNR